MFQTAKAPNIAAEQTANATFIPSLIFSPAAEAVVNLQVDFLVNAASAMADWLHRRHEAVLDANRLAARVTACQNANEMLLAHQEWMSREFQRLSADVTGMQSAFMLGSKPDLEPAEQAEPGAAETAKTDSSAAAGKPSAGKSPRNTSEARSQPVS